MLSSYELAYLGAVKRKDGVDAFLEEQALRSRASKSQQLRVYGYWQRGKVVKTAVKVGECTRTHYMQPCHVCGFSWGVHADHVCPVGEHRRGTFYGCEGGLS